MHLSRATERAECSLCTDPIDVGDEITTDAWRDLRHVTCPVDRGPVELPVRPAPARRSTWTSQEDWS
jgi:hypothetical protein